MLKELHIKSQELVPISEKFVEFEKDPDLLQLSSALKPRLDSLQLEFKDLDQLLTDRIHSLQVRDQTRHFKSLAPVFGAPSVTASITSFLDRTVIG